LRGQQQHDAERAAELDDLLGQLAGFLAELRVAEQLLALIDRQHQRMQPKLLAAG